MAKHVLLDDLCAVVEPLLPPSRQSSGPGGAGFDQRTGKKEGEAVGSIPTERGRAGTKCNLIADRNGVPLAAFSSKVLFSGPRSAKSDRQ